MFPFILFICVLTLIVLLNRRRFFKKRDVSEKLTAEVVEYRRERMKSPRNNLNKIDYPYVRILEYGNEELYCLRHATSSGRHYNLGDQVEVFWFDDKLIRWESYKKWNFKF